MVFRENFKNLKKIKIFGKTSSFFKKMSIFLKSNHFFQKMGDFWKTREIFKKSVIFRKTHHVKFYTFTKNRQGKKSWFSIFLVQKKVKKLSCRECRRVYYKSIIFNVSWGVSCHPIFGHFYPPFLAKNSPPFFGKPEVF